MTAKTIASRQSICGWKSTCSESARAGAARTISIDSAARVAVIVRLRMTDSLKPEMRISVAQIVSHRRLRDERVFPPPAADDPDRDERPRLEVVIGVLGVFRAQGGRRRCAFRWRMRRVEERGLAAQSQPRQLGPVLGPAVDEEGDPGAGEKVADPGQIVDVVDGLRLLVEGRVDDAARQD